MAQRDVVMLLAADDLPHLFTVVRCGLSQQLLEEGIELLLAECAALQQDLADGEHVLVRQPLARRVCEQVAAARTIIDDGGLALIGARLREVGSQLLDVTLDGLVRYGKFLRQLRLADNLAPTQTFVQLQQTKAFVFLKINLHRFTILPSFSAVTPMPAINPISIHTSQTVQQPK